VAYVFSNKGNKSISWETVGCFNTGFEFELFNNRLRGSVEFYDRKTTDMLMYYLTPTSAGYSGYYTTPAIWTISALNRSSPPTSSSHPT